MECFTNQPPINPIMPPPMARDMATAPRGIPPYSPTQNSCYGVQNRNVAGARYQNQMTPDQFPIAMAYVPWQRWQQTYSLDQGLQRGTIFPDLDLPFQKGRC